MKFMCNCAFRHFYMVNDKLMLINTKMILMERITYLVIIVLAKID